MKTRVGVLYGGKSPEHQVSLSTAMAVMNAIDPHKFDVIPIYITPQGQWIKGKRLTRPVKEVKQLQFTSTATAMIPVSLNQVPASESSSADSEETIDVIFPLLHGPNGEDGTVQGLLEMLNLPYVGNGVLASAVGMDKVIMKNLFAQAGLRQAKYVAVTKYDWQKSGEAVYDRIEQELGYRPTPVRASAFRNANSAAICTRRLPKRLSMTGKSSLKKRSSAGRSRSASSAMMNRFVRSSEKLCQKRNFTTMRQNMKTDKRN